MLIADFNPKTEYVHIIGKLDSETQFSLRSLGWRKSKGKSEFYTPIDIYIQTKKHLGNIYESDFLKETLKHLHQKRDVSAISVEDYLEKVCPIKLYPFQKEFVHWYTDPTRTIKSAFNACEPGLGKSFMALAAIFSNNPESDIIILCPRNAIGVWKEHLEKFGYKKEIRLGFYPGDGVCISTYEGVAPLEEEANKNKIPLTDYKKVILPNTNLIADEFHLCKNSKAKKTLRFKKLFSMITEKGGKTIALTGTPIMNRPMELKTLLENIDLFKKAFGNCTKFYEVFGGKFDLYLKRLVWEDRLRDSKRIKECLKSVLFIRKKEQILEQMPDITESFIKVDISKTNKKSLDSLYDKYKGSDILDKLKIDISNYSRIREALAIEKYKFALETIENFEDAEKPVVVFSDFVLPIESLGRRPGWASITRKYFS